ncbi:MAG TPA: hypothetical protein VK190_02835 [Pseudoneobacillus sp.]|jgi:hypothetical protein|nr:hypothetical protein [Pseudoneobacillus sp.]
MTMTFEYDHKTVTIDHAVSTKPTEDGNYYIIDSDGKTHLVEAGWKNMIVK